MMRPYGPPPIPLANAVPAHSTAPRLDRKSTRLNSSHSQISYAVFCLKKKKRTEHDLVVKMPVIGRASAPFVTHRSLADDRPEEQRDVALAGSVHQLRNSAVVTREP